MLLCIKFAPVSEFLGSKTAFVLLNNVLVSATLYDRSIMEEVVLTP